MDNAVDRHVFYISDGTAITGTINNNGDLTINEFIARLQGQGLNASFDENEIERIKKFNCDVIVIDHHNMGHQEFNGLCNDGVHRFAIVNNTIDNLSCEFDRTWLYSHCNNAIALTIPEFKADVDMSCGVLLYELLRVYQIAFKTPNILFENKLAQWAAITLFTDAIDLRNTRNQWYVSQLIDDPSCERVLKVILNIINPYKTRPSKTAVNYSLAPLFNKAIRANAGLEALNVLFYME